MSLRAQAALFDYSLLCGGHSEWPGALVFRFLILTCKDIFLNREGIDLEIYENLTRTLENLKSE